MIELENSIKSFNLIFTDTLEKEDFCKVGFDLNKEKVNYDNCISLYDIVEKFNILHKTFKKRYNDLEKFDLGRHIDISNFIKNDNINYRCLLIYIDEPTMINEKYTDLYLVERDNEIKSFITNNLNVFDKKHYYKEIDLDKKIVKQYLDLFENYSILLYLYHRFENGILFGDGTYTLFTNIKSENNELLDDFEKIEILLGANYFLSPGEHIKCCINLGNSLNIDVNDSKIEIFDKNIKANKEDYIRILKSIFINERYLNEYYDRKNGRKIISTKTLIKTSNDAIIDIEKKGKM